MLTTNRTSRVRASVMSVCVAVLSVYTDAVASWIHSISSSVTAWCS